MLSVLIPTYNRADTVAMCILGLMENMTLSLGPINYHLGVDGDDNTVELVRQEFGDLVKIHDRPSYGLGNNLNRLVKSSSDDFFMTLDDDHILAKPLDVTPHIEAMNDDRSIGMIRLYGVGSHNYRAVLRGDYWHVAWDSPEVYIPSFRPSIKTRHFFKTYGLFPTDLKLGQTEEKYCMHCKEVGIERHNNWHHPVNVCVPLNHTDDLFDHVGDSWQGKGM